LGAELGDHVQFKGYLSEYANQANGFKRGTSTTRVDNGNGACETVYLTEFAVIKKANLKLRKSYSFVKGLAGLSLLGFLVMFFIAPVRVQ
jgi:hypothetical protein